MRRLVRSFVITLAVAALSGPALAGSRGGSPVKRFDTDDDGTLDHMEVRKAATAFFARLDPDHDGTLSVNEYLGVVEQRFNAADRDHDGTIDAKELQSPAGRALLQLLQ